MILFLLASLHALKDNTLALPFVLLFLVVFSLEIRARLSSK